MIGRTIDAMLSPLQIIGIECRREGRDSILHYLINAMRKIVLPVEKMRYSSKKENGEIIPILCGGNAFNWSEYFPVDWSQKRDCAKVFEQRRKSKVGDSFSLQGQLHTGFGTFKKSFNVERIKDNAVVYRDYLISSDEKILMENKDKGYTPVLYRGVLW